MSEQSNDKKDSTQLWIASLGISVLCCALFFIFLLNYIGSISQSLAEINERLASMEARQLTARSAPHVPAVVPVPPPAVPEVPPVPTPVDAPAVAPTVTTPTVSAPSIEPPSAPTPVLPTVPESPAPVPPVPPTNP